MKEYVTMKEYSTDIAIIGAGPVGLFAIFEAGMLKMKCHVIDSLGEVGGQCTAMYPEKPIYDVAGFPSIDAADLISNLEQQAEPFDPVYHLGQRVEKLEKVGDNWQLTTSKNTQITAKAVVIAAGCGAFGPNRPPLENIEQYEGKSVFYLVKRKADFADKTIVIAGGGDSAVDWVNSLADVAKKIYVVHRRPKFRAAPESVDKMHKLAENLGGKVEMVIPYQLAGLEGDNGQITGVKVATLQGEERLLEGGYIATIFWAVNGTRTNRRLGFEFTYESY